MIYPGSDLTQDVHDKIPYIIYIYIYLYFYIYLYIYIFIFIYIYIYVCICIYIIHGYVCVYECMYLCYIYAWCTLKVSGSKYCACRKYLAWY